MPAIIAAAAVVENHLLTSKYHPPRDLLVTPPNGAVRERRVFYLFFFVLYLHILIVPRVIYKLMVALSSRRVNECTVGTPARMYVPVVRATGR